MGHGKPHSPEPRCSCLDNWSVQSQRPSPYCIIWLAKLWFRQHCAIRNFDFEIPNIYETPDKTSAVVWADTFRGGECWQLFVNRKWKTCFTYLTYQGLTVRTLTFTLPMGFRTRQRTVRANRFLFWITIRHEHKPLVLWIDLTCKNGWQVILTNSWLFVLNLSISLTFNCTHCDENCIIEAKVRVLIILKLLFCVHWTDAGSNAYPFLLMTESHTTLVCFLTKIFRNPMLC